MWSIFLCVLCVNALCTSVIKADDIELLQKRLSSFHIVPDVITTYPRILLQVEFPGINASLGNKIQPFLAKYPPKVSWEVANPNSYYSVFMVDLDYPDPKKPINRAFLNWLVVNVKGNKVILGEILAEYVGPLPKYNLGYYRYVFLVYKQTTKYVFDETYITDRNGENRKNFSVSNFTEEYNLGKPIATNFFQAKYDFHVARFEAKLNF